MAPEEVVSIVSVRIYEKNVNRRYMPKKEARCKAQLHFIGGTIYGDKHDCPSDLRNPHLIPSKSASSSRLQGWGERKKTEKVENLF